MVTYTPHRHRWTPWWIGASGNSYRACRDLCCDRLQVRSA